MIYKIPRTGETPKKKTFYEQSGTIEVLFLCRKMSYALWYIYTKVFKRSVNMHLAFKRNKQKKPTLIDTKQISQNVNNC